MHLLGIDVGTGGTRAVITDERGRIAGAATAEHVPFASPRPGWAEQDPRDWWRAAREAIAQALAHANLSGDAITGIGLTGQMHGLVLLDGRDEVLRPALIWCDQRTDVQCRRITDEVGAARLIELTSNPALTGFTLPKLLWVRDVEPTHWDALRSVLLPKDYLRFQLTGARVTDVSDASGTLMFDVARRRWSQPMLDAFDIPAALLPEAFESPEISGSLSPDGARATGLAAGTPVVSGAGDQAAGAVGMGIAQPGLVSATIGTSGVVFAATDRPALDPRGRVHTFCHAIPGRWHVMGVTQAAGQSLRWCRDHLASPENGPRVEYDQLTQEAASVPPGAEGVLWTPYLMGERTPHLDPHARAALVGLTASHTRAHIVRAILEGVAFSLRDSFEILNEMQVPVHRVRLGGGGARSPLWRRIQTDVYGHTVEILNAEEGAAYGAALLAGVGAGAWPSVDAACADALQVAETLEPDPATVAILRTQYDRFRRVYPALAPLTAPDRP